jgi:hypothetical protein
MKTWLLVIFSVAAFGCATLPRQPVHVLVSAGKSAERLEARTLDSASLKAFSGRNLKAPHSSWPPKQWISICSRGPRSTITPILISHALEKRGPRGLPVSFARSRRLRT